MIYIYTRSSFLIEIQELIKIYNDLDFGSAQRKHGKWYFD